MALITRTHSTNIVLAWWQMTNKRQAKKRVIQVQVYFWPVCGQYFAKITQTAKGEGGWINGNFFLASFIFRLLIHWRSGLLHNLFHDTPYFHWFSAHPYITFSCRHWLWHKFYLLKRKDWILNTKFVLDERESAWSYTMIIWSRMGWIVNIKCFIHM